MFVNFLTLVFNAIFFLISNGGYGPSSVINFSGYYDVHRNKRHLFYWFFESRTDPKNDPMIIWLTGGPGGSSMLALLSENGPYHLENNSFTNLLLNEYSWNNNSNIMWIDSPSGSGYSYDDNPIIHGVYTEHQIASDLYEFMQKFFKDHTKYSKLPFYVTGESYAGHYVPHFCRYIFDENKNLKQGNVYINLTGFAIGNGLIDPYEQYQEYAHYAFDYGLIGIVEYEAMKECLPKCLDAINNCSQKTIQGLDQCIAAVAICELCEVDSVTILTGINVEDIRKKGKYNFTDIDIFYNLNTTINGLGALKNEWKEMNNGILLQFWFSGDLIQDFSKDIPLLLENNIFGLMYNGEYDFRCNWYGGYRWIKNLNWTYNKQWNDAQNVSWFVDNQIAGYSQSSNGLTFLKVKNSGHMVPMDQPKNALAMIQKFTAGNGW